MIRATNNPGAACWPHLAAIALLAFLTYAPTLSGPFQFDDADYIVENPLMQAPSRILSPGDTSDLPANVSQSIRTRALGHLAFALDYRLGGGGPMMFHLSSIAIHALVSLLVYAFARVVLGAQPLAALVGALLFALHPVCSQAVSYVSQRFASMGAMFYLASVVSYAAYRRRMARGALYALSVLMALAASFTKETAFTIPLALGLTELLFVPECRLGRLRRMKYLVPHALVAMLIPLILLMQSHGLAGATKTYEGIGRLTYALTEVRVLVTYLRLALLPIGLTVDYDYPLADSLLAPGLAPSVLALLAIPAVVWLARSKGLWWWRPAAYAAGWFAITLMVESGPVALADVIFEHRMYLPMAGALPVLAMVTMASLGRIGPRAAPALMLTLLMLLMVATVERNRVWGSVEALWRDVVAKAPAKARGHGNLADVMRAVGRYEEARSGYETALALDTGDYAHTAYNGLGEVSLRQGRHGDALRYFQLAIARDMGYAPAYSGMARAHLAGGRPLEALGDVDLGLALSPRSVALRYVRAAALHALGRDREACAELARAREAQPDGAPLPRGDGGVRSEGATRGIGLPECR